MTKKMRYFMTIQEKIIILVISIIILTLAIIFVPVIVYENARNWYGKIGQTMNSQALLTDLSHMNYGDLSSQYKSKISREYFDSVTEEELYDFYSFVNSIEPKQGVLVTLFGAEPPSAGKGTMGFIQNDGVNYIILYEFIVRPSLLTLEPVVEKWTIKMQKYDEELEKYGEFFYS